MVQIVTGNLVEVSSAVRIEIFNGVKWYALTVRWSVISKRYWYLAILILQWFRA